MPEFQVSYEIARYLSRSRYGTAEFSRAVQAYPPPVHRNGATAVRVSVMVADNQDRGRSFSRRNARKRHRLKFCSETCLHPLLLVKHAILCETRPWSGSRGRGKFSHHPLDDRHEGGAKPVARGAVRFSRVVPALLVSALRLRSAQRAFAGGRSGLDTRFFPAPAGTSGAYGR